jgi:hypothetical protein
MAEPGKGSDFAGAGWPEKKFVCFLKFGEKKTASILKKLFVHLAIHIKTLFST